MPGTGREWTFDGVSYRIIAASDVSTRDGFGYELWESGGRDLLLEAFWDDSTGLFTFTAHTTKPLPFRLVEAFIEGAAAGVPPTQSASPHEDGPSA
jgi:hypothetical protein